MSEIEKMYENCNIKPKQEGYCDWDSDCPYPDIINSGCGDECPYWKYEDEATYPPFTAEKQIELIKWLSINYLIEFKKIDSTQEYYIGVVTDNNKREWWASVNFENALAAIINNLWQDLTDQERTEIAEILRG